MATPAFVTGAGRLAGDTLAEPCDARDAGLYQDAVGAHAGTAVTPS